MEVEREVPGKERKGMTRRGQGARLPSSPGTHIWELVAWVSRFAESGSLSLGRTGYEAYASSYHFLAGAAAPLPRVQPAQTTSFISPSASPRLWLINISPGFFQVVDG